MPAWTWWALASALFAALTAILAKVGVGGMNPDAATFVRTLVVIVALGGILLARGQWNEVTSGTPRGYLFLVLSGLATGASWVCYFRALKAGDAARVSAVDKLSLVLTALFAAALLGEKLSPLNWLGLLLVSGGVVLVSWR